MEFQVFKEILWRSSNIEAQSYCHCVFENIHYSGVNFFKSHFEYCEFKNCSFENCTFTNCDFSYTSFDGTILKNVYLLDSIFLCYHIDVKEAIAFTFDNCWFRQGVLFSESMKEIYFIECRLAETSFIIPSFDFNKETQMSLAESYPLICPEEGSFIGWKKGANNTIIKLLIPEEAKRSSGFGRKCRADRAYVLEIKDENGNLVFMTTSQHDSSFEYQYRSLVSVDDFCENRWRECAQGIHFFMTRQEAINYR